MMTLALRVVLLAFAIVAYAGSGSSLAVIRHRHLADGDVDWGMVGVATLLLTFGALCTALGVGWSGVLAFGGVALGASYVFMAQHIGLFRVDAGAAGARPDPVREPRQHR